MTGDWITCPLGDVIELKRGYDLPQSQRCEGNVPIVSSAGISGAHNEAMARAPGVVTGRYGTIGQVFFLIEDFWPLNTTLYVRDFKGNDPKFISYFLRSLDFSAYSDKAAVPGLNRNHLHEAIVSVPRDVHEQRAIARILGSLDDKIELSRRSNKTLEAMARALFKDWFIDFGPVRSKVEGRMPYLAPEVWSSFPDVLDDQDIPSGWKCEPLDEIAEFLNGLALQKYPGTGTGDLPVIKISQLRAGISTNADRASNAVPVPYVVTDGDVLFSWSGSLLQRVWTGGTGALNQHLFKVTSTRVPKWMHYYWVDHHLPAFQAIAASKATTMGHIQRHHLHEAMTVMPDANMISAADNVIRPLFDKQIANELKSRTLATLRGTLLPKLLSGDLRVRDAERFVSEHIE